jgi:tetratricopeptide (TPR) repeat protein
MDVNRSLRLKRKVIDLQMAQGDTGAAEASLDDYLRDPKLSDSERAWALGEKSHLLADAGKFIEARALLGEALRLNPTRWRRASSTTGSGTASGSSATPARPSGCCASRGIS